MSYAMINLKYNDIDNWKNISVNSIQVSFDENTIIQKNAEGTESYLQIGAPLKKLNLGTAITEITEVWEIENFLIASAWEAEVNIYGYGIRNARIVPSHSGSATLTSERVEVSYSITLID